MAQKKIEQLSTADKVSAFFLKNKKIIYIAGIALVATILAFVIVSFSISSSRDKALVKLDGLEKRILVVEEKNEEFDSLVTELKASIKNKSYASVKSAYVLGQLYFNVKDYNNAYEYFYKAYDLNKEIYLSPLALINAAVASENNNDSDTAIDCYNKALDYEESGVEARALFNLGRIYLEDKNNVELAKTYFELVASEHSYSEYAKLAQNLLTTL